MGVDPRQRPGHLIETQTGNNHGRCHPDLRQTAVSGVFSMASRENQGLHIALILLVMLTVGLCVLSFVFYSSAQKQKGLAETAVTG